MIERKLDVRTENLIKEYFFCCICDTLLGTESNYVNLLKRNVGQIYLGSKSMDNKTAKFLIETMIYAETHSDRKEYHTLPDYIAEEDKRRTEVDKRKAQEIAPYGSWINYKFLKSKVL